MIVYWIMYTFFVLTATWNFLPCLFIVKFDCFLPGSIFQIGEAMKRDPGFLKLRKIRAAQKISKIISETANNRVIF